MFQRESLDMGEIEKAMSKNEMFLESVGNELTKDKDDGDGEIDNALESSTSSAQNSLSPGHHRHHFKKVDVNHPSKTNNIEIPGPPPPPPPPASEDNSGSNNSNSNSIPIRSRRSSDPSVDLSLLTST